MHIAPHAVIKYNPTCHWRDRFFWGMKQITFTFELHNQAMEKLAVVVVTKVQESLLLHRSQNWSKQKQIHFISAPIGLALKFN